MTAWMGGCKETGANINSDNQKETENTNQPKQNKTEETQHTHAAT